MKKALMVATVGRFLYFEKNDIKILQSMGYEVHCAANLMSTEMDSIEDLDIVKHHIDFSRSPFSKSTFKAYQQLCLLLKTEHFDVIHCHTPVGGILARIAGKKYRKTGTKIIYTAHGFHFYKNAPIMNWLIYYPIEKLCSYATDILITINKEDYLLAKKKMRAKQTEYIPGIGLDLKKFKNNYDRNKIRQELKISKDAVLFLSVGELNKNKNHETVIKALADSIKKSSKEIYYVIAGKGVLKEYLSDLANHLGIEQQVKLVGFRNDIPAFFASADIFLFPSQREGLSVALMEAMASELPVLCSRIRGNTDLIDDKMGGYLFNPMDVDDVKKTIEKVLQLSERELHQMGKYNLQHVQEFSISKVEERMKKIYGNIENVVD